MSQFEPIGGVSLKQYAKLCALMSKTQPAETDKHAQIALENGVTTENWEKAKSGWTAMMMNPQHAMAIQQEFMPEYQRCLAELSGDKEPCSLEDYARIKSAMMFEKDETGKKVNFEIILARDNYKTTEWGTIESYWSCIIGQDVHGRILDKFDAAKAQKYRELVQQHSDRYNKIER
ncbi:MAG: hypothetical protein JNJ99_16195 [Crocinitomicaceae bacterium]|nr:hypothetical protein [Crocinitomicaceae bacterium]